jgi:hypothetical protein
MKNKPLLFLRVALRAVIQTEYRKNEEKHIGTPYHPRHPMKRLVLIPFLCSMAFAGNPGWMKDPMTLGDNQVASGAKTWTNNQTFSNPNKTVLLGASTIPDISGTDVFTGLQLLVSTRAADTKFPFAVVADYRAGSSGDRYTTYIGKSAEIFTNAFMLLWGSPPPSEVTDSSMLTISPDVPIGVVFAGSLYDADGGRHIKAYGALDKNGHSKEVFSLGGQGTLRIYNPYGIIGSANYATPQLILGNIGYDCNNPTWTYGSINQNASGEFIIGTYDPITANEGREITIIPGKVSIRSTMDLSPTTRPPTPSNGHVVLYAAYDGKLHALDSHGVDHPLW